MAIQSNIVSQKFFNEFENGFNFNIDTSDFTQNLAANVMERVKVVTDISIKWQIEYVASGGDPQNFDWELQWDGDILTIIRNDGGDFRTEGFAVGQTVRVGVFQFIYEAYDFKTILSIAESQMVIDMDGVTSFTSPVAGIRIVGQEPLTALIYDFGLIENLENFNTVSKVTQGDMSYYAKDIGTGDITSRNTSYVDMISRGTQTDWITGSARVKFLEYDQTSVENYTVQVFRIEHTFIINPWYLDGGLQNLIDRVSPEILEGDASLKYVFNSEFRQVLNNPNISYSFRQEDNLGSVGWFGESFNGFNNGFNILDVTYRDKNTLTASDGIILGTNTQVIITIESLSVPFQAGDKLGVYFSYLPKESDYIGVENKTMLENFMYSSIFPEIGGSDIRVEGVIKNAIAGISAGIYFIIVETVFTSAEQAYLAERKEDGYSDYLLAVEFGDRNLSAGNSDRLLVIADINQFDDAPDIPGLAEIVDFYIYDYPNTQTVGTGYTDMKAWNEDGLFAKFKYRLNLIKEAYINSLEFSLIAYNDVTGEYFRLDSYDLDLSNGAEITSPQVIQQLFIEDTRGYPLQSTDDYNKIEFKSGLIIPTDPPTIYAEFDYDCIFAQKITWQAWIENLDVDPVFLDESEPNSNRNLKASNYSLKRDYTIRMAVFANITGVSEFGLRGATDYLHLSPALDVYDYEEDGDDPVEWTGTIETFRASNDEDLGGIILSGEDTIFKTTWSNRDGAVSSVDDIYAVQRIEETNQAGYQIYELGTRYLSPEVKVLQPLTGETELKIEIVGGNVVTTCLIKGNLIDSSKGYNISAKIGGAASASPSSAGFDLVLDTVLS